MKRLFHLALAAGLSALAMLVGARAAMADKRVALVIGNSSYQSVPKLPNPQNDAEAISKMFKDAGFDSVDLLTNVGNLDLKRGIRRFEETADQADIAVIYYAGHGVEIAGSNYLIPVDARLASDRDADDEAISLERLVASADGAKRLRLIILDACRDNPFVGKMRRERSRTASRAVSSGLGKIEPTETNTLIAYAAKAGSTADDGVGTNSPFTRAILKDLPVPGLDIRLAFGRVRDEVMKLTANRQEPFVYGSLGGGNVALVPAPTKPQEAPINDVKADFELVQRIGTQRAWEVFLGTHPSGFYADLARAQMEALTRSSSPTTGNKVLASLEQSTNPRSPNTVEELEWSKVKDSSDIGALQKFIKRYPDAPLSIAAQERIELLNRLAQEREEAQRKARAQRAEEAARKKREESERRAAAAEATERARAAAAEAIAQKKREEDERRAAAAEAARQAKQAEADRKAKEAAEKAEKADRDKAAKDAAAAAAAAQRQTEEAEAARKKADLAAQKEESCKNETVKLDSIIEKGSEGNGTDELKEFSKTMTCERLGPVVAASLDRLNAEEAKRAAERPNALPLVRAAQAELIRLGCFSGRPDGSLVATQAALSRYNDVEGLPAEAVVVTKELVADLVKRSGPVCSLECGSGKSLKGDVCVVDEKIASPTPAPSRIHEDGISPREHKQATRDRERRRQQEAPRREARQPEQKVRQQAQARPSASGGGGHPMLGVGF